MAIDEQPGAPEPDGIDTAVLRAAVAARMFSVEPYRIGRFGIERRLGAGGMGTVYLARDPQLLREVAIKVLHTHDGAAPADDHRALREAQAMAKLQHPNVVAVFEAGEHARGIYIAMEYVRGTTLRRWLGETPRSLAEIVAAFVAAGRGLAAAHAAGLVHRDFKPDNVLVGDDGRVAVTDFGLARADATAWSVSTMPVGGDVGETPDRTDAMAGTPAYMAPECLRGGVANHASDQFSFCVALYEALFETRPTGGSHAALARLAGGEPIRLPANAVRLPRWLRRALLQGLQVDPQARWPSMAALVEELDTARSRRRRNTVIALVAALGLGALALPGRDAACRDLDRQLREVWSPEARAAIAARIDDIPVAYARTTWNSASVALDGWVERWNDAAIDACRAARVAETDSADMLDRRMTCLDRGRRAATSLITTAVDLDVEAIERLVGAVVALPAPEDCSDREALVRRVPLPADPEARARIETAAAEIADARSAHALGRFERAEQLARQALGVAHEHAPTEAEAQLARGDADLELADGDGAIAAFEAAVIAAERGGADADAALAWVSLVDAQLAADRLDAAEQAARMAEAKLDHAGDHGRTRARLLRLRAELAVRRNRLDDATALVHASGEILRGLPNAAPGDLAGARLAEAFVDFAAGRYADALAGFRDGAEIHADVLGVDHPRTLLARTNAANALVQLQRLDEALAEHRDILALREAVLGPDHPLLSANLIAIAAIDYHRGRISEAIATQEQAIRLLVRTRGPEHHHTLDARDNLVPMLLAADRTDDALAEIATLLTLRGKTLTADDPALAFLYHTRAQAYDRRGELELAIADVDRAIAITQAGLSPEHADLMGMLTLAARLELRRAAPEAAQAHIDRALAIGERAYGADSPALAATLRVATDVAVARGDAATADRLRARAAALAD